MMKNIEEILPERKFITPEILMGTIGTCYMFLEAFSLYWTGVTGGGLYFPVLLGGLFGVWGMLFGSIILTIICKNRRSTAQLAISIAFIAILGSQLIDAPLHWFYPLLDLGIKQRVTACGGVEQIQTWALAQLEKEQPDGKIEFSSENLPPFVQCLNAEVWMVGSLIVNIGWGGSWHSWGIRIEPPKSSEIQGGYECGMLCTHEWSPGMYSWQTGE